MLVWAFMVAMSGGETRHVVNVKLWIPILELQVLCFGFLYCAFTSVTSRTGTTWFFPTALSSWDHSPAWTSLLSMTLTNFTC